MPAKQTARRVLSFTEKAYREISEQFCYWYESIGRAFRLLSWAVAAGASAVVPSVPVLAVPLVPVFIVLLVPAFVPAVVVVTVLLGPGGVEVAGAPVVAALIADVDRRACKEVAVSVAVAVVDVEGPRALVPRYRAVEIAEADVAVVLPRREHIPEVGVAALPPRAEGVSAVADAHQIVEVDFIYCGILLAVEAQLVGHLVRQEQGFAPCFAVSHCRGRDGYRHHHGQNNHLLHNRISCNFYVAKIVKCCDSCKGFYLFLGVGNPKGGRETPFRMRCPRWEDVALFWPELIEFRPESEK